ncbi:MAG: hypothetical protein FWF83_03570 [Clostridiales bacterium]|nr:hypothetical protein [Clostridiales bacterium]
MQGGQPGQGGQQLRLSDGSGGAMTLSLPERAVVVQTGIINDTFVEILSGLEEGQLVELSGSAATSGGGFMGNSMFVGPGPIGGGPGGAVMMTTTGVASPR